MKTKAEIEFERLSERYYEMFGTNYPLDITSELTFNEHLNRLRKAIENRKPVKTVNVPGLTY